MNLYYKILIMMFLNGALAAVTLLVLGREISCQDIIGVNTYTSIAAAYAAGAAISFITRKAMARAAAPAINIMISFSAIAGIFISMAALFFIRYYRPLLGISAEQQMPAMASVLLPVIVFLPCASLFFTGLAAGEALCVKENAGKASFLRLITVFAVFAGLMVYLLFLWRYFRNIDVLYAMGILLLAAVYVLFRDKTLEGRYTMLAVITAVIIYLGFNMGGFKDRADEAANRAAYKNYSIIAEKEFPTIKFMMAKKGDKLYVFENGVMTYAMPDAKYAEMAKLAYGKNVIILNGGAAGLVGELEKNSGIKQIIAYEEDPYTSFILEKLYRSGAPASVNAAFKAGDFSKDGELGDKGFTADTVFMNAGKSGMKAFSARKMEAVKSLMAQGARLVISAPEKENTKRTVRAVFGNAAEEKGFITAVRNN